MERDRKRILVEAPQLLEHAFGLAARIDKDQRGLVPLDQPVNLAERVAGGMPGPGQPLGGIEHGDIGRRASLRHDEVGECRPGLLRHKKAAQIIGLGHGCGQTDAAEIGSERE